MNSAPAILYFSAESIILFIALHIFSASYLISQYLQHYTFYCFAFIQRQLFSRWSMEEAVEGVGGVQQSSNRLVFSNKAEFL